MYIEDGCPLNPGRLRCPSAKQVAEFDDAVRRGDLLWADSPMNLDPGVVGEPGMFEGLLDIAGALNERYNISKKARVWSNIPLLIAWISHGITNWIYSDSDPDTFVSHAEKSGPEFLNIFSPTYPLAEDMAKSPGPTS